MDSKIAAIKEANINAAPIYSLASFKFTKKEILVATKISAKNPEERTFDDVVKIAGILKYYKFLNSFTELLTDDDWIKLSLFAVIESYGVMSPICEISQPSEKTYFILQGEVAVVKMRLMVYTYKNFMKKLIVTLRTGDSFGEAGVLLGTNRYYNISSIRSASCISLEGCVCLTFERKVFSDVLEHHFSEYNNARSLMLSRLHIFKDMDRNSLMSLLNYSKVVNYLRGTYVYKRGERENNIYIIVSGEFEIVYPYDITNSSHIVNDVDIELREFITGYSSTGTRDVSLLKLYKGDYFGDEDGYNTKFKEFSLRATSQMCMVYQIPKDVYFPLIN